MEILQIHVNFKSLKFQLPPAYTTYFNDKSVTSMCVYGTNKKCFENNCFSNNFGKHKANSICDII